MSAFFILLFAGVGACVITGLVIGGAVAVFAILSSMYIDWRAKKNDRYPD